MKKKQKKLQKGCQMTQTKPLHQPVMLKETIDLLEIKPDRWYVDATFGRGGHTKEMIKRGAKVVAFDFDVEAIKYGKTSCAQAIQKGQLILVQNNFDQILATINNLKSKGIVDKVWGVLFDLGTSVDQLKSPTRGFSFENEAPLDMRMDQDLGVTAYDLLVLLDKKQLAQLFWEYGGETQAKKIASAIKNSQTVPETTTELAQLVSQVKGGRKGKLHPATKVFQALRIAVNTELENIKKALPQALSLTYPGGNIVAISFHEGEDRLVKNFFKTWQEKDWGKIKTKKPQTPSEKELKNNPRARSAKLRAFRKKK